MNRFVKLTTVFLVILAIFFIVPVLISEAVLRQNAVFELREGTKHLIVGHSHPECAFNDSLIDGFQNVAQSGEPYFYAYFKIKEILKDNPTLETVFIEFANNNITCKMDDWMYDDMFLEAQYTIYSPFMKRKDWSFLASNNSSGFINVLFLSSNANVQRAINRKFNYSLGGYRYLVRDKTDSLVQLALPTAKELKEYRQNLKFSTRSIEDLKEIIAHCQEKGKKVYLIRSPLHDRYEEYDFEAKYQKIRQDNFSDIEYLDFSKFRLKDSEFADFEHLNYKGAKIFSEWFNGLLEKGLLDKKDKQQFIEQEYQARLNIHSEKTL
jgi:hypothetical protein